MASYQARNAASFDAGMRAGAFVVALADEPMTDQVVMQEPATVASVVDVRGDLAKRGAFFHRSFQ